MPKRESSRSRCWETSDARGWPGPAAAAAPAAEAYRSRSAAAGGGGGKPPVLAAAAVTPLAEVTTAAEEIDGDDATETDLTDFTQPIYNQDSSVV